MVDYLPKFKPGQTVTFTASTAVTGGRLVALTGEYAVGHAPADSAALVGVAGFDAAAGETVTVFTLYGVQRLNADAAIAVGTRVASAAAGRISGTGTNKIGLALTAATAQNDVVDVLIG